MGLLSFFLKKMTYQIKDSFSDDFGNALDSLSSTPNQVENPTFIKCFSTDEIFELERLFVLHDCLSDLSIQNPENTSTLRDYRSIDSVVNFASKDLPYRIEENYFIREMDYGHKSEFPVGRIASFRSSISSFSRRIRYFLFKDLYIDVDLKNSHPTILYHYATTLQMEVPFLSRLVEERESVFEELGSKHGMNRDQVKKSLLVAINLTSEKKDKMSNFNEFQEGLLLDVREIRQRLYYQYFESDETTVLQEFLIKREDFAEKSLEEKQLSVQNFHCFTEETHLLLSLKTFLERSMDEEDKLSFIPFFDGAYVKFRDFRGARGISDLLIDFNADIYPYEFVVKDISIEIHDENDKKSVNDKLNNSKSLLSVDKFNRYLNIHSFLNQLHSFKDMEIILERLQLQPYKLTVEIHSKISSLQMDGKSFKEITDDDLKKMIENHNRLFLAGVREGLLQYADSMESLKELLPLKK